MCSKFEQFRGQTATIDGLVQWCQRDCEIVCRYCAIDKADPSGRSCYKAGKQQCKAGIKAYWEGIDE